MAIVPDGKDWTWVLDRPCPECGLDTREVRPGDVAALLRANAAAWPPVLTGAEARRRPAPRVWSPLEYACHVRDVFRLYDQRLHLMLTQDDPLYPNWDQDATALEQRYGEQDPAVVAGELTQPPRRSPPTSTRWAPGSGAGPGGAVTAPASPWPPSRATSSTTRSTTSPTSPADTGRSDRTRALRPGGLAVDEAGEAGDLGLAEEG